MMPRTRTIVASIVALLLSFGLVSTIAAQSSVITTGVVFQVETAADGKLNGFSILDGDGSVVSFTVSTANPNTSFGLENRVGDRWVSDLTASPVEAATRLRDQQQRLTSVSVQSDANGVAISVVQAESANVDANLGYLFAVVAIAWLGIIAYVLYLGIRQRTVSAELDRLQRDNEE